MFISNKHLDRRTFLRGVGATVALPLLDAMIPRARVRRRCDPFRAWRSCTSPTAR